MSANGIIVQARMGSSRLPGKVLRSIEGKPLLEYLIERLQHWNPSIPVVVATSVSPQDDPIADYCKLRKIPCFRGSLDNVAERFLLTADRFGFDSFVRLSGDSPLLDTRIISRCLGRYNEVDCDLVTNIFPRTFPRGQSAEVLRTASFRRAYAMMNDSEDREHVTRIYYRQAEQFRIENVACETAYEALHLAIDTREDLECCETIIRGMTKPHWQYDLDQVVALHRSLTQNSCAR